MSDADLPEQQRVRADKRRRMIDAGLDPYPVTVPRTSSPAEIRAAYDASALGADARTGDEVAITGRVIFRRDTGRLCFLQLREGDSELQVMVSPAEVGENAFADLKTWVDLGDLVSVTGEIVTSRRGELSISARSWQMAAKAIRPLPIQHRPLSDEARVRMRYLDLIVRQDARTMVRKRATVLRTVRSVLDDRGFLEVETPVLQYVHGGAAEPFSTHLRAFDEDMTLRIALEPYLKRAIVGGLDKVYEIGRNFRNEGIDSTHHPEFTMLEAYQAYADENTMADLTRSLVQESARAVGTTVVPDGRGGEVDLTGEWRTVQLYDCVSAALGEHVGPATERPALERHCAATGLAVLPHWDAADMVVALFEALVEPTLLIPTFVRGYPRSARPLARHHRDDPRLSESWDLIVAGMELAVANSELSDPTDQRARFEEQARRARAGDVEAMEFDEDFLRALEVGMPPTGGMGMGIDRLLRLLTGAGIRETILFPLVRPG